MSENKSIPIWFFIGLLLFVYGILCLGAGIVQFSHPPSVEMPDMHATFWGGVVLFLVGGTYTLVYWPRKK
ncbi:hypothetical protein GALL_334030 [mine drainage metagenome]|uniref:Uncharacterized protein n=1 Tax=mine drainage metagenome TaxID=410659 RepID=A0A1J5QYG7_9ZZZZ